MRIKYLLFSSLIFSGVNAYSITPQKYCESLAASSCEVLNIEVVPGQAYTDKPVGVNFKYCRDRVFKLASFKYSGSGTDGYGSMSVVVGSDTGSGSVNMSNVACSQTYTYTPPYSAAQSIRFLP